MHSVRNSSVKRYAPPLGLFALLLAATALIECSMGHSFFGPDGRFGWWEGDIWSSENSQRLTDPYCFSHIAHGLLFYGLLHLCAARLPVRYRFLMAAVLEASWELLENSPLIINRYRAVTISLGYNGDSILNSLSDIGMMSLGFALAYRLKPRVSLLLLLAMEVGCAWWIRDNLALNILMLVHPLDAIRQWQSLGHA